jgi:hypothetical protein
LNQDRLSSKSFWAAGGYSLAALSLTVGMLPPVGVSGFRSRSSSERREHREHIARGEKLLGGSIAAIHDGETGKVTRDLEQLDDIAYRGARGDIERCGVAAGVGGKVTLEKREETNFDLHPTCAS